MFSMTAVKREQWYAGSAAQKLETRPTSNFIHHPQRREHGLSNVSKKVRLASQSILHLLLMKKTILRLISVKLCRHGTSYCNSCVP